VVLAAAGCGDGRVTATDRVAEQGFVSGAGVVTVFPEAERPAAPDFSGPLLGGDGTYTLADDRGSVVVLNVWGSWCAPCRKEAPALQRLSDELAADGVRFVGVNTRDRSEEPALAFVSEFGVGYPNVYDPTGSALLAFRDTLPPAAIPSTLVVDRQGRMAARVVGVVDETVLADVLADLVAEPVD
jgi:thiol-disulfide isomerase/thioredoxin